MLAIEIIKLTLNLSNPYFSGCFCPGVIDLRKSSGVINISLSPVSYVIL